MQVLAVVFLTTLFNVRNALIVKDTIAYKDIKTANHKLLMNRTN